MDDDQVLIELIKKEVLTFPKSDVYGRPQICLKETESNPPYQLVVKDVPHDAIVIKADKFSAPSMFNGSKGERKLADYIIVSFSKKRIIYIEMKRGGGRTSGEIEKQLKGAACLVAYCRALGQSYWNELRFLCAGIYEQRFVSVKNIGIDKRPSRLKPLGLHDSPEKMLKISAGGRDFLKFRELS